MYRWWPACLGISALVRHALAVDSQIPLTVEEPLLSSVGATASSSKAGKLHGRFLHITDLHPDPFYKVYSSTDEDGACHRGIGPAGMYGAEVTDCDSPFSLINATFDWIEQNLKGKIDFVVWTGDSARHDNDEGHPRDEQQVISLNTMLVRKFNEVFGKDGNDPWSPGSNNDLSIPIVPTFGNNDILPHNILQKGPNRWTNSFASIWRQFVPEEQRHGFNEGGWFYVEVIPNHLAVFSLNTLYFFDKNSAVDGCASKSQPGYQHMEWLRIQLQFIRQRNMKAILIGHVPPARTEDKTSWDETCWQKYTLWMQQYRDVVVGSLYGHMNIDHFMLQDFEDINSLDAHEQDISVHTADREQDEKVSITSETDYLMQLRDIWAKLPNVPSHLSSSKGQGWNELSKKKKKKYLDKLGGEWAERFAVSLVAASVVPNYFPTVRVFEYNITGIQDKAENMPSDMSGTTSRLEEEDLQDQRTVMKKKKKKFRVPKGPSKHSPPGPAYSPQPLSWIAYTQYYANLTYINHDFDPSSSFMVDQNILDSNEGSPGSEKWKGGKHPNKRPHKRPKPNPRNFTFEVEYDTSTEQDAYSMGETSDMKPALTVRGFVELAAKIGKFNPSKGLLGQNTRVGLNDHYNDSTLSTRVKHKKHKKHKKDKKKKMKEKERKDINKTWFAFIRRAFVGAYDDETLKDMFGVETTPPRSGEVESGLVSQTSSSFDPTMKRSMRLARKARKRHERRRKRRQSRQRRKNVIGTSLVEQGEP